MFNAVWINTKQAICNKGFLIASLGMASIILINCFDGLYNAFRSNELQSAGTHFVLFFDALNGQGTMLALPMLASLPYSTTNLDDMKSGFIIQYLPRIGLKEYICGKIMASIVAGGLSILVGAAFGFVLMILIYLPMEAIGSSAEGQAMLVFEKLLLLFASGALWSISGFLLASITKSRYMAYAGPFVICYFLNIFYERYFDKLYVLYPREWLNPSEKWGYGVVGVILFILVLTIATGSIFALWAYRKLVEV